MTVHARAFMPFLISCALCGIFQLKPDHLYGQTFLPGTRMPGHIRIVAVEIPNLVFSGTTHIVGSKHLRGCIRHPPESPMNQWYKDVLAAGTL